MALVHRDFNVPPEVAFQVFEDGWLYALWVVGTSHIRDVDDEWPAVGSHIYHAFGAWPFVVRDQTEVLENDAPHRLVLQARAWPAGQARIELTLEPRDGGCRLYLDEYPVSGLGKALHNPLADKALHRRNVETLNRLAPLVEHRAPQMGR
jgi:uncharacterized protein YndB with AHSA1/START domain